MRSHNPIYPLLKAFSVHINMATMTTLPGTSHILQRETGLNSQDESPLRPYPGLTFLLGKTFPSPTGE